MKTIIAAALAATLVAAQRPADWRVRFDRAGVPDSAMKIDQMGPGWHFYTAGNGSGIAYQQAQTASGNYRAEASTFLFPTRGHRDGYGLIIGGQNLDGDNQSYTYFLVRGDGQYLIKHRAGTQTHDIVTWTEHAAIPRIDTSNVRIVLAAEAGADSVRFQVNGQQVHALPRARTQADGIVGLRVNHGLSVHVGSLSVTQR